MDDSICREHLFEPDAELSLAEHSIRRYVVHITTLGHLMRSVTAREANQAFSRILKEAEGGEPVVITRRGQPVAIIAPYRPADAPQRERAIDHIVALMRRGLPIGGRRFTRDEMHERDQL
jgi:prevent-host-death family protein